MAFHQDLFNCQRTRPAANRPHQLTRECCARTASSFGGADWNRTSDPLLAKQVLSQLSYSPAPVRISVRANPLIVNPVITTQWWAWIELNYRPRAYQARALTN